MQNTPPQPSLRRVGVRWLTALALLVSLSAAWSACERVTSALEPSPTLTPSDLPVRGQTPLPTLLNKEVSITFKSALDPVGLRHKAGPTPTPQVNAQELETMLMVLTATLHTPHVAIFGSVDTTSSQWRYAYTALKFDVHVLASAGQKTIPFLYTHITSTGMTEIVAAMIPDTPAAHRAMRLWLKAPMTTDVQLSENASNVREKGGSGSILNSYACGPEGAYDCAIIVWSEGLITLYCWPKMCVRAHSNIDEYEDPFAGGGSGDPACRDFPELCAPDAGYVSEIPTYYDCNGKANGLAYWDPVCPARCVGGGTGRQAAKPGDDCNNLNIPCAGDVVKNPEITSSGASGKTGGRFRPCVEGPWSCGYSFSCSLSLRAVRKDGLGGRRPHHGTDYTCNVGDPIFAPFDMDGLEIGSARGYGYYIRGWSTIEGERLNFGAAHLRERPTLPASGSFKQGDIIGYCGRSGIPNTASGRRVTTHVHIEMGRGLTLRDWRDCQNRSQLVDPESYLATKFSQNNSVTALNPNPCGQ